LFSNLTKSIFGHDWDNLGIIGRVWVKFGPVKGAFGKNPKHRKNPPKRANLSLAGHRLGYGILRK
jgi:hypothetical protein